MGVVAMLIQQELCGSKFTDSTDAIFHFAWLRSDVILMVIFVQMIETQKTRSRDNSRNFGNLYNWQQQNTFQQPIIFVNIYWWMIFAISNIWIFLLVWFNYNYTRLHKMT